MGVLLAADGRRAPGDGEAGRAQDPDYLSRAIEQYGVTTLHFVPSMLQSFLADGQAATRCGQVVRVMCSGEALPAALVAEFYRRLPQAELHNLYGPTEAAVDVTAWHCSREADRVSVPIGRPIANTRIYLLDDHGQPVPLGRWASCISAGCRWRGAT